MTQLVSLDNISLAYGLHPLLDHVKLQIQKGERVCLIGRNGAGKSSLLKIIAGTVKPDAGSVWRKPALRIATLEQVLPQSVQETVYEFVASGLAQTGAWLKEYFQLTHDLSLNHSDRDLKRLEQLQNELDTHQGWQYDQQIQTILTRLQLDGTKKVSELSGGWQRRAALAKALVTTPELLLLDEPTNHLDIEAIEWMEQELLNCNVALLFITHDRALLQRLATRIIELDRGNLTSWLGDYENFLRRKAELLHAEAKEHADFDKKLAQEEKWIRQGIKARRTRNEGRVRALKAMRTERSKRRLQEKTADFSVNRAETSGQIVFELQHVSYGAHTPIIHDLTLRVDRGDRIGLIGPNGVGKTTLLNILLGNLKPDTGSVKQGTNLEIAYFDQLRRTLDLDKTVLDNVAEGRDSVEINGKSQHIISYLSDFLFTPERALTPLRALSGGECNRLLLAKLFAKPSNVLIMDEPTNDLDIETLELLEEILSQYQGTLLLVSHDRIFLDNVVTNILVFSGQGKIEEHVGGYHDWLQYKQTMKSSEKNISMPIKTENKKEPSKMVTKLSYKEQKELDELPKHIETLELQLQTLQQEMSQEDFYKKEQTIITEKLSLLKTIEEKIHTAYTRWDELETKQKTYKNM